MKNTEKKKQVMITITNTDQELLRMIGYGNVSLGVRIAAAHAKKSGIGGCALNLIKSEGSTTKYPWDE